MNAETWARHFRRMAEGKLKRNHKGHYVVEKVRLEEKATKPTIELVTPVAQAVEIAKSELKEVYKGKSLPKKSKKKKTTPLSAKRSSKSTVEDFLT